MPVIPYAQWNRPIEFAYRCATPIAEISFHSHSFYEIYYFHEGQCTFLIGDRIMTLAPGDLILMHGMTLHQPNPQPHVPYIRTLIHFDPAYIYRVLPEDTVRGLLLPFGELRNYRLSLSGERRAEIERLLEELSRLYEASERGDAVQPFAYERFTLRFCELLYVIKGCCRQPVERQIHRSERERHVQNIISYLERCYHEPVTLDAIAAELHLTKTYVSNLFKDVTGTTVFQYLYNRRINQAKIQFRLDPHMPVTKVGKAVGFAHPAHFTRVFKAAVGCTPDAYRRRMLELQQAGDSASPLLSASGV